jgi:hypothetical protein
VPLDDLSLGDPLANVRKFEFERHVQYSTVSLMPSLIRAASGR